MNADRMAEFLERAGYRVARTASADWYVSGASVYKSFPYGRLVAPTTGETSALARQRGIVGVEYPNDLGIGVPGGTWIVRDPGYGLHSLQRQFRQRLLRALAAEEVRPAGFDELIRLGMTANRESLARLRYDDRHLADPASWERLCRAGAQTPGAGAIASFSGHRLTSYLLYFVVGDTCYGLISKSIDAARTSGSNLAVYYTYTRLMIRTPGIATVAIGAQNVPPLPGLDRIKRHAGYELQRCSVAVVLRPMARALVAGAAGGLALALGKGLLGPRNVFTRAAALRTMVGATDAGLRALRTERGR